MNNIFFCVLAEWFIGKILQLFFTFNINTFTLKMIQFHHYISFFCDNSSNWIPQISFFDPLGICHFLEIILKIFNTMVKCSYRFRTQSYSWDSAPKESFYHCFTSSDEEIFTKKRCNLGVKYWWFKEIIFLIKL
jgi:hypothetical protein